MVPSIDFSFMQRFINFQLDRLTNYFLSTDIKPTVSLQTIGGCRRNACGKRSSGDDFFVCQHDIRWFDGTQRRRKAKENSGIYI